MIDSLATVCNMPLHMTLTGSELRMESHSASRFAGRTVHFIGVGGSGMSGLARMLLDAGATVTGSDPSPNQQTLDLQRAGVRISREQRGELLSKTVDLVVRTAAVPDSNPEFLTARELGLPHLKYAQLLGEVMAERLGVAVAGTHGKSTTSAMASFALTECGADPSYVIGGHVPQLGGSSHSGAGKAFVVEACEFDRSFHNLRPRIAIITNIEEDHLDCYPGGISEIRQSFHDFARRVPGDGLILINACDLNSISVVAGLDATVETVTITGTCILPEAHDATWTTHYTGLANGCPTGTVFFEGRPVAKLRLSVAGLHNLANATMALAACAACGVKPEHAADALSHFTGVERRMSEIGSHNGAIVVDDYAHHPTEILTTLKALRQRYNPARLICVFQPHQHSRTRLLINEFATCFELADETVIADIYSVRDSEQDRRSISAADLVARVNANGQHARHVPSHEEIVKLLKSESRVGDLVVTMGAGNIWQVAHQLVEA